MGKDYSCVPEAEIHAVDMECEFNQFGLCNDGAIGDVSITTAATNKCF